MNNLPVSSHSKMAAAEAACAMIVRTAAAAEFKDARRRVGAMSTAGRAVTV